MTGIRRETSGERYDNVSCNMLISLSVRTASQAYDASSILVTRSNHINNLDGLRFNYLQFPSQSVAIAPKNGGDMASIREIGPGQFRVEIRRRGIKVPAKTFETRQAAQDYATVMEGKVVGGEYAGPSLAHATTLDAALTWYEERIIPRKPASARNKKTYVKMWRSTPFANWMMAGIMPWDLVDWRAEVLDEDNALEDSQVGPSARFGTQQCWHYLQLISHLFVQWGLAHRVKIDNPVSKGVRPILDDGRDRRLILGEDENGNTEEQRMMKKLAASHSKWLPAAAEVAIETVMRQTELATLPPSRVILDGDYPYVDLSATKNDLPRRVPLSKKAVSAFKRLEPLNTKTSVLGVETGNAIGTAFRLMIREDEFPDLRWHDLRHEGISRLFENTDLRDHEIMLMSGHLSTQMLKRYTHLRSHRLAPRLN